jgi:hypothetical protein
MAKKSIPAAAATVLGFCLKFIPVPKKSIYQDDIDNAIKQFDRDFYLKVHFADDNADTNCRRANQDTVSKQLKDMPDQPPINIGAFEGAITRNFQPRCRKSNLTKFQANILQQICSYKDIGFSCTKLPKLKCHMYVMKHKQNIP